MIFYATSPLSSSCVYPYCKGKCRRGKKNRNLWIYVQGYKKGVEKFTHTNTWKWHLQFSPLYEDFFIIFIVEGVKKIIHTQYIKNFLKSSTRVQKSLSLSRFCWAVVAAAAACCCICEKKNRIYKEAKKKSSFSVLYIYRMNSNTTIEKQAGEHTQHSTWNFRQFLSVWVLAFSALLLLLLVS